MSFTGKDIILRAGWILIIIVCGNGRMFFFSFTNVTGDDFDGRFNIPFAYTF